jgi:hypothetical protein
MQRRDGRLQALLDDGQDVLGVLLGYIHAHVLGWLVRE